MLQMKKILLFSLFVGALGTSYSQNQSSTWMCESSKETYQIVLEQRGIVNLPITICDEFTSQRLPNERKTIQYSPYLKIVLLSQNEINAGIKFNQEITIDEN